MKRTADRTTALAALMSVLTIATIMSATSRADVVTWDGGGGDGLWTNGNNWSGTPDNTVPGFGDTVNISNGDTVTSLTGNLPGNLTVNLSGNSTLTRPDSVIRFNGATFNVASGSGLTGNGFWDLNNADITFDDGAIATMLEWEQKGVNSFTFNLGATGFSTLTPVRFRNDANNAASPATLIADDTYTVDMANFTGGLGVITLMDFVQDLEGMDNATFQNANLNVINAGQYIGNLQWNDTAEAIELNVTGVPEPSSLALVGVTLAGLVVHRRRRARTV